MHINEIQYPIKYAWEGQLIRSTGMFLGGGDKLPAASIGVPMWWSEEKLLGEQWQPPDPGAQLSRRRYGLARFAFSLAPNDNQKVRRAEFTAYLQFKDKETPPIFYDLFPQIVTSEEVGELRAGIGPDFKFKLVEVAETTIALTQAVPVSAVEGSGQSIIRWVFTARPTLPIGGQQLMYAVVELPPGVPSVRVTTHLVVEVITSMGPVRGFLPKTEHASLGWMLE